MHNVYINNIVWSG